MSTAIVAKFEELRSVAFGSIGATYAPIGTDFQNAGRLMKVDNLTDADLLFSMDGATDHFVVPAGSGFVMDVATNRVQDNLYVLRTGGAIHVKQLGTPTSGSVYVAYLYASTVATL